MTKSIGWTVVGVLSIIAGVVALLNPLAATLTAERLAGWLFLIVGFFQLFTAFRAEGWGGKLWALLWALITLWCGVVLLWNPGTGIVTLTGVLGVTLLLSGVFKAILAFKVRITPLWWMILISAVLSIVLGFMILNNLYAAALGALGVILGIELIQSGFGLIAVGKAVGGIEQVYRK